jgi:predicted negative regulator of RcsB-dependent stress response
VTVKRLLQGTVLLATAGWLAWWYWQSANHANAQAWAEGTDTVD